MTGVQTCALPICIGGVGYFSNVTGSNVECARGGTCGYSVGGGNSGTPGGGGHGARWTTTSSRQLGGPGATGIVIISYPITFKEADYSGIVSYSVVGNNRVYRFSGNSTISWRPNI